MLPIPARIPVNIYPRQCVRVRVCEYECTCACVVRMCFVLQVQGLVLHGAGAHVCRAPGAVQECRAPGAEAHVCRAAGAGANAGAKAGAAGAGAGEGAGAGAGAGAGPSPLITVHPPTKL